MYTGLLGKRYAAALLSFAKENGEEPKVYSEMKCLGQNLRAGSPLTLAFESPVLKTAQKIEVAEKCIEGEMSKTLKSFLGLVIKHNRGKFLRFIVSSFLRLYRSDNGIRDIEIVSTSPISKSDIDSIIMETLPDTDLEKAEIKTREDNDLIGGFVLRADERVLDQSIKNQLLKISKALCTKN